MVREKAKGSSRGKDSKVRKRTVSNVDKKPKKTAADQFFRITPEDVKAARLSVAESTKVFEELTGIQDRSQEGWERVRRRTDETIVPLPDVVQAFFVVLKREREAVLRALEAEPKNRRRPARKGA
ncbi:hypothetical protein BB934_45155 (plasmid) [Microvirga ossetica]|uniref:Uncharacterized protein n=1 Tax=Microvirga ossetica TaxID=1882682 RepID=A0A1B2EZJ7_9HYPH|nr:hypothetical protein [Microvirga ossetica]ANY85410.1 hypothetical protein BB934_45155 [Microvirga ossetica]